MVSRTFHKLALAVFLASLLAPFLLTRTPADALKNPCALDPNNLIVNGSMSPGHGTAHGIVAENWESFLLEGEARFNWVGNEQIDPNGSQFIHSLGTFDGGVWQTVHNLQPNVYYWFRLGYSLAAKSYSGPNVRVDSIGRKVGVDPFGGTDPKSPNVIWGPDYFDGVAALNIPDMTMVFAARSSNATVFLRAIARDGSSGVNRVWRDAVCMEAKSDMATATPPPPTATPVPPTATLRPTQVARAPAKTAAPTATRTPSPTKPAPAATEVAQVQTPAQIAAAPLVAGTLPASSSDAVTSVNSPRFARPEVTPEAAMSIDLGTGAIVAFSAAMVVGALLFFAVGFLLWKHFS